MFIDLRIILTSDEALVIPEEAVVSASGAAFVYVLENDRVERRKVLIGRRDFGIAEILEGLDDDAVVITHGTGKLRDGMAVTLIESKGRTLQ
jgi:membrane fusion protein (multidrug efflux system)